MTVLSPDARPYVDLTLLDRDPRSIFELALTFATTQMPNWVPRAGTPETVILEAAALEVAETVYAINRLPGATVETVLRLFGITFDVGAPPEADVEFTFADNAGHTVPAGTRLRIDVASRPFVFTLDTDTTADPGETTAVGHMTGVNFTSAANGVTAGQPVALLDSVFFVETATLDSTITTGRDPEDAFAWFNRAAQRFVRLTDTLVRAIHFEAAAIEDPAVHRVHAIDLYDGTGGPPYTDTGHVSVYVYGLAGPLTTGQKNTLLATLVDKAQVNLEIHVLDATVTDVDVDATYIPLPGFVEAVVTADIEAALQAYLSPLTWRWSDKVYLNDVIQVIENVPGVDRTVTGTVELDGSATDFDLAGDGPLANAGVLTITAAA